MLKRRAPPAGAVLLLALSFLATSVRAERDLSVSQPTVWYGIHGASTAAFLGVTLGMPVFPPQPVRARWGRAPGFERFTEVNLSRTTRVVSDVGLLSNVLLPFGTLAASGSGTTYGNAALIYGETVGATLALSAIVKRIALRARPYVHSVDPDARAHRSTQGPDAYYSFYSGHSAGAFTGAIAGSYLFDSTVEGKAGPAIHWGLSTAVAAMTAHARVRAGQHYPTDVIVGSMLGIGMGFLVPSLHQVDPEIAPVSAISAGAGALAGIGLAFFLPDRMNDAIAEGDVLLVPTSGGMTLGVQGDFAFP